MKSKEISYSVCDDALGEESFIPSLMRKQTHEKAEKRGFAKIHFTSYFKYNKATFLS